MAASSTTGFNFPAAAQTLPATRVSVKRRRRITPEAGRALEILAHAIEYLTDEFVHQGPPFAAEPLTAKPFAAKDDQLQAVKMLMALNRQVYFECPEVPTFGERCRALLFRHSA